MTDITIDKVHYSVEELPVVVPNPFFTGVKNGCIIVIPFWVTLIGGIIWLLTR